MDTLPPLSSEPPSTPAGEAETDLAAALALIEAEGSDGFDHQVAAHACGAGGLGFVQARVLRWDPRIEAFHVTAQSGGPIVLRVLMHVIAPESIGATARIAWTSGAPSHGEEGVTGGFACFGAVPFGHSAVLVGRWSAMPGDAGPRLDAWSRWLSLICLARARHLAAARAGRCVAAVRDLAAMVVTPHHLSEVVHAAARLAAQACDADGAAVWLAPGESPARLEVCFGSGAIRDRAARTLAPTAQRVTREGTLVHGAHDIVPAGPATGEIHDVFAAPLGSHAAAAGALAVWREARRGDAELPPLHETGAFLVAVADLLAAALERARDQAAAREAEQRAGESERERAQLARRAGYGSLADRARADAAAAAAGVRLFAARLSQSLEAPELARDYADALVREAERLDRALATQDACSGEENPGDRALVSINDLVNDALRGLGERLAKRRVRLLKRLSPDVPKLVLDERRIAQAIGQLLAAAMDSIAAGGRVRVETRRLPRHVALHVAHDGAHSPGEALDQLFVPFVSGPPGGPPVALGVADRIVHDHGGEIRVRSEGEWSTVVDLALPIRDLEDRRSPHDDRRSRRDRRTGALTERNRAAG